MTSRRGFLTAAAGVVFCGCGMRGAANAQTANAQTLPVTVRGERVKTVDVHAHCIFHEAAALLGEYINTGENCLLSLAARLII